MLAVEAVLVQFGGRPVRSGDNRHSLVEDKRAEQPAHDHRVGGIVDHHLVEAKAFEIPGKPGRNRGNWIAAFLLAFLAQQRVDFEHKGMEMDPAFLVDLKEFVEQVHQHGFAATYTAPQIDTARVNRLGAEQSFNNSWSTIALEPMLEQVQFERCLLLVGIVLQFARLDQRGVFIGYAAQADFSACIFLISEIARAGESPLGQTLAQFMIVWQR